MWLFELLSLLWPLQMLYCSSCAHGLPAQRTCSANVVFKYRNPCSFAVYKVAPRAMQVFVVVQVLLAIQHAIQFWTQQNGLAVSM